MGFRSEFRGTKEWLDTTEQAIKLDTVSDEAAKHYDATITQLCGWYNDNSLGGLGNTVKLMREADPNFKLGAILELELNLMGAMVSRRTDDTFDQKLAKLEDHYAKKGFGNRHEELHFAVVQEWTKSDLHATYKRLEKLVTSYPEDVSALKMLQDMYFMLGTALPMRNSLAYSLAKISDKNPLKGYVHGMFAFALEESNMFAQSQSQVEKALALIPRDTWAIHNYAHCLEMQGKVEEGLKWMADKKCDWQPCQMLACHQYWHTALFHINNGQFDEAVHLLDNEVLTRCNESCTSLDTHDAASMIYRMELVDLFSQVKQGPKTNSREDSRKRWQGVYDICKPNAGAHNWGFDDAHYMMSFLGIEDEALVDMMVKTVHKAPSLIAADVVEKLLDGMRLFKAGEYVQCVDKLEGIRFEIIKLGGSHAQRDIFDQLLLVAALKSSREDHNKLGQRMLLERDTFYGRRLPQTELLAQQALNK